MTSLSNSEHHQRLEQYRRQISYLNSAPQNTKPAEPLFGAASSSRMAQHVKQQAKKLHSPLSRAALLAMLSLCQWDVMDLSEQDYRRHF